MDNEVGMELEDQNAPPEQRSKGKFSEFFKDPKNIATALVFGAALAQPRQQGADGLSTLMQRAAGAAAFRGALESGIQNKKLQREQTAFERAQQEQQLALQGRQVAAQEQGVGIQAGQLGQAQTQFEASMAFDEEQAAKDRALQLQLANAARAPSEKDWMQMLPSLTLGFLDTMEFTEGMSETEKMQLATSQALQSMILARNLQASGGQIVVRDGKMFVDDGNPETPDQELPRTGTTPQAAPTPPVGPVGPPASAQFAPTTGEQLAGAFNRANTREPEVPTTGTPGQAGGMFATAMERFRRSLTTQQPPQRSDVALLARFSDRSLQTVGMTPAEIQRLRQLQGAL